ncbi:MAG TPA: HEAT repeat domain-containing protein [Pyrinomonadaceae bacterium]|nr:HEAT repeat domain-containing protein [Pyrinomonadaceae bacterium]
MSTIWKGLSALLALLLLAGLSGALIGTSSGSTEAAAQTTQQQSTTPPVAFITVEGASLTAKMEEARRRARAASPQTPYWSAYSFDVRPGVAIDPQVGEFHGSMNSIGSTHVFVGTSQGRTVETRNLGIFVLRDPSADVTAAPTRIEVYNLERKREYSRYPVYWFGRAGNEESLDYLRGLVEQYATTPPQQHARMLVAEHATLAVALHDDARVADQLRNFARRQFVTKVRATAVYWLGQVGGQQQFLSDIVRDESENKELRRAAAHAIGASRDRTALATLQGLYDTVTDRHVRIGIIHAAADNEDEEGALNFLLKIARSDAEREARRAAIHQLGDARRESIIDELMKIYAAANADPHIQTAILHTLSEMKFPRAEAKLLEIARTGTSPEVRAQAIHRLGERGTESVVDELMKLYEADQNTRVRSQILHAFSEMKSTRAEDKLFEVARRADSRPLRSQAIHLIGERAGRRSLDMLTETATASDTDTEVQIQAVRAIGERPADEAVPLLIKIARTHQSQVVRQQAIRRLGESGDPRAVEFFKELLGK